MSIEPMKVDMPSMIHWARTHWDGMSDEMKRTVFDCMGDTLLTAESTIATAHNVKDALVEFIMSTQDGAE